MIGLSPAGFSFVIILTFAPKLPEDSGRVVLSAQPKLANASR
jgi:hypothetical protein